MTTATANPPNGAKPQKGAQEMFLHAKADIVLYGGGAYGGKSWALTVGPLRYKNEPFFNCVTFRRDKPMLRNPGSLWDESMKWYPQQGGSPRESNLAWDWPNGVEIKFDGLQHDQDALSFNSAQITRIQFDQLEEFSAYQFWYMQTRNRNPSCRVRPSIRAGCNPMAETWLADFIQWWWDQETGYAITERSGQARWYVRVNDEVYWASINVACDAEWSAWLWAEALARSELDARFPGMGEWAQSVAFIRASLADNAIGTMLDPSYEGKLRSATLVEQERLLWGNWKIRAAAGLVFDRGWFEIVPARPALVRARARAWDKAGTAGGGDWTAGVLGSLGLDGVVYIEDVERGQWAAGARENVIHQKAEADVLVNPKTRFAVEQEPGSGGKDAALLSVTKTLAGYDVRAIASNRATGNLIERVQPLAAQAQVENVKLVRGPWNEQFLREVHAFPTDGVPDDVVSAAALMYKLLTLPPTLSKRPGGGTRSFVQGH
jgi:predicted phage terminase large subunit-like protein